MLDYFAHLAVLERVRAELGATPVGDPAAQARVDEVLASAAAAEDAVLLGAVLDQVVAHASADAAELTVLERAADLWQRGLQLYAAFADARSALERAVINPLAPSSVDAFNGAVASIAGLRDESRVIAAEAAGLKKELDSLDHIPPHPRQQDRPLEDWRWGDIFIGRRGDAFVRALFAHAVDDATRAVALGGLACYSGNAGGSAYLGHVVGGPRRAHRYRDRLARNAVGAWLRRQRGLPDAGQLASRLAAFGLPAPVAQQLDAAFAEAFDRRETPPAPSLALGVARTVHHLQLLDVFRRPALPVPPAEALASAILATATGGTDPAIGAVHPLGAGTASGSTGSSTTTTGADGKDQSGDVCIAVIAAIIVAILVVVVYCVVEWIDHGDCDLGGLVKDIADGLSAEPEQEPTDVTAAALTALVSSGGGAHMAQHLFDAQMMLWQGLDQAYAYLAVVGLIPPDDLLLTSPLYGQFLSVPLRPSWPHGPEPHAESSYHLDPVSTVEQPATVASYYPTGANPTAFLHGHPAVGILHQIAAGAIDAVNLDQDADRGVGHPCWTIVRPGSIVDVPVPVTVLAYEQT